MSNNGSIRGRLTTLEKRLTALDGDPVEYWDGVVSALATLTPRDLYRLSDLIITAIKARGEAGHAGRVFPLSLPLYGDLGLNPEMHAIMLVGAIRSLAVDAFYEMTPDQAYQWMIDNPRLCANAARRGWTGNDAYYRKTFPELFANSPADDGGESVDDENE